MYQAISSVSFSAFGGSALTIISHGAISPQFLFVVIQVISISPWTLSFPLYPLTLYFFQTEEGCVTAYVLKLCTDVVYL